jgi:hypothetical protein
LDEYRDGGQAGRRVVKTDVLHIDTVATSVLALQEFVLKRIANDPKRFHGPIGRAKRTGVFGPGERIGSVATVRITGDRQSLIADGSRTASESGTASSISSSPQANVTVA